MKQGHSWRPNRSSASQEFPPNFTEPDGSSQHAQEPATCPLS